MHLESTHRIRAATFVDVLVAASITGILLALALPALSNARADARTAQCAANLNQLAKAAHRRAADHDSRFFVHKTYPAELHWGPQPGTKMAWWDADQIGQYLGGLEKIKSRSHVVIEGKLDIRPYGMAGEALTCPQMQNEVRSYDMNYWASGITMPAGGLHPPLQKRRPGVFFGTDGPGDMSKRLLFGETLALRMVAGTEGDDQQWATGSNLGRNSRPGLRFGAGHPDGRRNLVRRFPTTAVRWGVRAWPTLFDFGRHGGERGQWPVKGSANFAFVDGHVELIEATDLYDAQSTRSTYAVTWTEIDRAVEDLLLEEFLQEDIK